MGILTNHGAFDWHVACEDTIKQGRLAGEYCKKHGIELGKLAIWYAAQLKGPATFLVGMSTNGIRILVKCLTCFEYFYFDVFSYLSCFFLLVAK